MFLAFHPTDSTRLYQMLLIFVSIFFGGLQNCWSLGVAFVFLNMKVGLEIGISNVRNQCFSPKLFGRFVARRTFFG